jgi:predicted GNAT superfamily acetyltransferase
MTAVLREFVRGELAPGDLDDLCRLNNDAMPAVPFTGADEMAALVGLATHCLGVIDDGRLAAFLIALGPGIAYDSENYRWFEGRGAQHLYVDRIVVDAAARSAGLGRRLYAEVFALARAEGLAEVTCEVNVDPPNPRSLAFHARLGFEEVGRQRTKGGSVEVALLAASVPSGGHTGRGSRPVTASNLHSRGASSGSGTGEA